MKEQDLVRIVKERAGLRTAIEARRALAAGVGALRCALDDEDTRSLSKALPAKLARLVERPPAAVVRGVDDLYAEGERRERVGPGFAREHVQVVLQVLQRELDPELVTRLRKHLAPDIAELLGERAPSAEPPPHLHVHPAHLPAPIQTLSRARPGTAEPVAETRHELAHDGSVVRSPAPHAERMIETAHSTRPDREDETLAGGGSGGAERK
jgi:uncharacterized protein (DUF2267 family)